ncbi:TniQ family protein [Streptomyces sp. HC44]|uniref:TniQ family protein n=1 Tax=Streptomyces scabichelini TaxID=2711217 RepID=A0A6G4V3C8_9ACTN|nr:TniQ family protein [Streptomyces scabichelini]NGO08435.1 TniQ family protein [Streptomyces scabichelini]
MPELPDGADLRTFPLRLEPLAGEAFDSWVEAVASRMHASIGEIVGPMGLPRQRGPKTSRTPNWVVCLRPEERQSVERVTGIAERQLFDMTLERWHPHVLEIDSPLRGIRIRSNWALSASRFCPACLAENGGRWQLSWRLGWTFACERHQLLLADRCPCCGGRPRLHPHPRNRMPKPGTCVLPVTGTRKRCGFLLPESAALSLADDPEILDAQRLLGQLMDGQVGADKLPIYARSGLAPGQMLADLRAIFRRLMPSALDDDFASWASASVIDSSRRFLESGAGVDITGGIAPRDAATTALGLTAAVGMLGAPNTTEAGSRVAGLLERTSGSSYLTLSAVSNWTNHGGSSVLREVLLGPTKQRLQTCGFRGEHNAAALLLIKRASGHSLERARATPAMLWPRWALQLTPPNHTRPRTIWRTLAVHLVQSGTKLTAPEVARLLGCDLSFETLGYTSRKIAQAASGGNVGQALAWLADTLDRHPPPIDYARRRITFNETDQLVSPSRWQEISRQTRPMQGAALQASRWVYETLTGNPAEAASGAMKLTGRGLAPYREFRRRLSPAQVTELRRRGEELLSDCGIEEPLTWEPDLPSTLLQDLELPGSDPESIDAELVSQFALSEDLYPKQIAERLGTTADHIRYVHDRHPLEREPKRRKSRAAGDAETWRRQYVEERWTLYRISASSGASQRDISQQLRSMGVELRRPNLGRYAASASEVVRRYTQEQKSLQEIAAELHISTVIARRILEQAGVERRHTGPRARHADRSDDVVRHYARGDSVRAIHEATGIPTDAIRRLLAKANVPRRRPRRRSPHQERAAEVVRRYTKNAESLASISRATGMAQATIRGLLVAEGVAIHPPGRRPLVPQMRTQKPSPHEGRVPEIVDRYRQGASAASISRSTGIPDHVVRKFLKREGYTLPRSRGAKNRSAYESQTEEMVQRHILDGQGVPEISKAMGIPRHSVRYLLHREGVLRLRQPLTAEQNAEVVKRFMEHGESMKTISRATGLGVGPVRRLIISAKAQQQGPGPTQ